MASLWDEGDIAEAVTKAKNLGALFIVFVEGENDLSSIYAQLFTNEDVLKKLKSKHFVAIKLKENSTAHQQFSAIYPHSSIPSIFFIGKNGKPVEIITDHILADEFNTKIDSILEKGGIILPVDSSSSSLINKEKQSEHIQNVETPPTTSEASSNENQLASTDDDKEVSSEKKLQHAKDLIELRKDEKKKQEEEAERLREIERRKVGQNVQQMKRWQQDEELKQLKEEREKEKRENQAARDRVLAQIAQDKAERAAKFSSQGSTKSPQAPQQVAHHSRSPPRSNTTKLQFRLPDGSVNTHEFQITDTLEIVHQYILNEMQLSFTNYTLSTTFPRREFTVNDNSQSLLDLQLVPNAVVLILPQNQGVVSTSSSGMIGNVFWWLLAPFFNIYDFFIGFLFGRPVPRGNSVPTSGKRPASDSDESNRNLPKRQASDTTEIKRQGNIHRLRDRPDTDDDNNTWNGNSTQQM